MRLVSALRKLSVTALAMCSFCVRADTVYYSLENVVLEEGTQMTGIFAWTYDPDDFENGTGQFLSLEIPYTAHDESDLKANIDATQSIEITLEGSVHDDGVDITLVLSAPLTPTTSSPLVLGDGESKYEIGGNGFHTGIFVSGSISPIIPVLQISKSSPDTVTISWEPDLPGYMLQQSVSLGPGSWTGAPTGSTNPAVLTRTRPAMFFRLAGP